MKKILFKSGSTMMGGLEKVQIEYINFLVNEENIDIRVIIENDNGKENVLEKEIKTQIEYLKDFSYIKNMSILREKRKKNILSRIKYNLALLQERKYSDKKFLKIYNEYNPDIVIDFDSSLTKIINKLKKSQNLVWIHSSVENWKKSKDKIKRFIGRLNYYDKIICICEEMKEDLIKLEASLEKKVHFLYNPVDFEKIKRRAEEPFEGIDKTLSEDRYLLTIARFDCVPKDFETLFKAFDLAKEKGYDGKLYVIGDGEDRDKVVSYKEKSIYKDEILLLGRKENPYNWLKYADKFILSSRYEGFPTVLIEALTLNKNIISSNCKTGPKEILLNATESLFEVGNIKKLANHIAKKNKKIDCNIWRFDRKIIFSKLLSIMEI